MRRLATEGEFWAMYDTGLVSLEMSESESVSPPEQMFHLARATSYALFAIALRLKLDGPDRTDPDSIKYPI